MALTTGMQAPDFTLVDENNQQRRLSDYRGRPVVLYFYPKDDTSGCTTEACNFRDDYSAYVDADVLILGVSPDSADRIRSSRRNTLFRSRCWPTRDTKYVMNMVYGAIRNSWGANMRG